MKRILVIEGLNPIPWQASNGRIGRRGGKPYVQFYKPENLTNYQEALAEVIGQAQPFPPFPKGTPLDVTFLFWREREQYHGQSGKLVTASRADTTNMVKATEDALHGIMWADDVDNLAVHGYTVAQGKDVTPRIAVIVTDEPLDGRMESWTVWSDSIINNIAPVSGVRYMEA
jgi:Holliday junction resolvase RusA-like endonuclease